MSVDIWLLVGVLSIPTLFLVLFCVWLSKECKRLRLYERFRPGLYIEKYDYVNGKRRLVQRMLILYHPKHGSVLVEDDDGVQWTEYISESSWQSYDEVNLVDDEGNVVFRIK